MDAQLCGPFVMDDQISADAVFAMVQARPTRFQEIAVHKGHTTRRKAARQAVDELLESGAIQLVQIGGIAHLVPSGWRQRPEDVQLDIDARSRITFDGCVEWLGSYSTHGKPMVVIKKATGKSPSMPTSVRRWLWTAYKGRLTRQDTVTVKCDNPRCVAMDHLVKVRRNSNLVGKPKTLTHRANIAKAQRKLKKLSIEDARAIRASSESVQALAAVYGVSTVSIRNVLQGKTLREYAGLFTGLLAANDSRTRRRA